MLIFGPVPSRRLGRSLGINNIPPKSCSYSCTYCQVGPTPQTEITPRTFYEPARIVEEVRGRLALLRGSDEGVDYLTFVPDGEPTLDARLGEVIEALRPLGIPIAVISNGSLLFRADVRERLGRADWVSVKIDAIDEGVWHRINRPNPGLTHQQVLEGISAFAADFRGCLCTETMLVSGVNDTETEAERVGRFVAKLTPDNAYLSVPIRPPAMRGVGPPDEHALNRYFQTFHEYFPSLELLSGYEGDRFASTGDLAVDLLAIAAVHPLRESAVQALVDQCGGDWQVVERLVAARDLVRTEYGAQKFYIRRLNASEPPWRP